MDVKMVNEPPKAVVLPAPVVRLLIQILDGVADGRELRVSDVSEELTIEQAAQSLDVPESFVAGSITRGELAARDSASGFLVSSANLQSIKESLKQRRIKALRELQEQAQELGLGY